MKHWLYFITLVSAFLLCTSAHAETGISPYTKQMRQPEKFLYIWTSSIEHGQDFLSVIDVDPNSVTYGTVLNKVEVGSSGNEAHHMGFTDDRTKIWALGLGSNKIFIFDVDRDPANPKLIRTIENVSKITGLTGPHTPYAISGRMLVTMSAGSDGTGPGGLAEFTNDGEFVASHKAPNHLYAITIKQGSDRILTSSWLHQAAFMSPPEKWDPKEFSDTVLVWDLKTKKVIQELKGDPITLAIQWALKPNATYGYTISLAGDSIWMFQRQKDGNFNLKKVGDTGKGCGPADLRLSPDDHYLYVSCSVRGEIQAWDISKPDKIRMLDTVQGIVQPNMMHMTWDRRRLYVTNSVLSTTDSSRRYAVHLIHIGPDGRMKLDPFFRIDFSRAPYGPARPHDILLN